MHNRAAVAKIETLVRLDLFYRSDRWSGFVACDQFMRGDGLFMQGAWSRLAACHCTVFRCTGQECGCAGGKCYVVRKS